MSTPPPDRELNDSPEGQRRYRWPRLVLGFVILWFISIFIWVWVAVKNIERERDITAPLPASAPVGR